MGKMRLILQEILDEPGKRFNLINMQIEPNLAKLPECGKIKQHSMNFGEVLRNVAKSARNLFNLIFKLSKIQQS